MKKIRLLFLLLLPFLAISQVVPADASQFENIQMTNNATSATAAKVVVQEANGVLNTIAKSTLQNVIEVASASALPATGAAGVIYVTLDNQLQYRWTGSIYNPYFESKANLSGAIFTGPVVVPTATLANQAVNKAQLDILKHVGPTGLNEGGVMSTNTNTAEYDLSAGFGYVVNGHSDVDNPTYTKVTWTAKIGNTIPNLATQEITYIAIDINGDLFPTNAPLTATQRRNYIRIGRIIHLDNASITYINNQPTVNIEVGGQVQDILEALGFRSLSGNRVFPVSTNLKIKKEVGRVFKSGANFETLTTQPHSFTLAALDPITFKYRTQTGAEGASVTNIDPAIFDNSGTITPVGSTATLATIQRIFVSQSNEVRIQPGQRVFTTLNGAVTAINSDVFVTDTDIFDNFLYLGAIVLTRNTVNLSDIAQAIFVPSIGVCANGSAPVVGNFIQNGTSQQTADLNISGTGVFGSSVTSNGANFDGVVALAANAINSKTKYFGQIMAGSDYWRIYGDYSVIDRGIMAFEVGDNGDPFSGTGQKYEFRYAAAAPGVSKIPLTIDYNNISILANLDVVGSGSFSQALNFPQRVNGNSSFEDIITYGATNQKAIIQGFNSYSANTGAGWRFITNNANNVSTNALILETNGTVSVPSLSGNANAIVKVDAAGTLIASAGYKIYTALLTQSGTAAPVATVLENTLGGTVVLTFVSTGNYAADLSGVFTANKTAVIISNGTPLVVSAARSTNDRVSINCGAGNDRITNATIEIRVYNFIFLMAPYSMTRRRKKKLKKLIK